MQGGSRVGEFKGQQEPLLRSQLPGFVDLLLFQFFAKLAGTSRLIQIEA